MFLNTDTELLDNAVHFPKISRAYAKRYPNDKEVIKYLRKKDNTLLHQIHALELNLDNEKMDYNRNKTTLLRRFVGTSKDFIVKFQNTPLGELIDFNKQGQFELLHTQSFSNSPKRKMVFEKGKLHVAVGFVDLELLMNFTYRDDPDEYKASLFLGYEMSTHSVVKSLVVYEMIKDDSVEVKSVIEVWFSSIWGAQTLKDFYKCLERVEYKYDKNQKRVNDVKEYWRKIKPLSAKHARREWRKKALNDNLSGILPVYQLKRNEDRVTIMRYIVTGEIFKHEDECSVANVTMFQNPEFVPQKVTSEFIYQSIPFLEVTVKEEFKSGKYSLMRIFVMYCKDSIMKLRKFVIAKKIAVELRNETVNLKNAHQIRQLNPWTMSWSNIIDYFPKDMFHELARACSTEDTIHCAHSMNWIKYVKGTFIFDYQRGKRKQILKDIKKRFKTINKVNPLNYVCYNPLLISCRTLFQWVVSFQYSKIFVRNFLENRAKDLNCNNYCNPFYSPFRKADAILYLLFTYNNEILNKSEMYENSIISVSENMCSFCEKKLVEKDSLKRCSRCRSAYYCSRKCQMNDWKKHKKVCDHFHEKVQRGEIQ